MCNFFSGIITKDNEKCLFSWESDAHENIKNENNLKDDKLPPDFVPVELSPPWGDMSEMDLSKWIFKTDLDVIPEWYDEKEARELSEKALKEFIDKKFYFKNPENPIRNERVFLLKNSSAVLRENSSAELRENSRAMLWGNSSALLWENSSADNMEDSSCCRKFEQDKWTIYTPAKTVKATSCKV